MSECLNSAAVVCLTKLLWDAADNQPGSLRCFSIDGSVQLVWEVCFSASAVHARATALAVACKTGCWLKYEAIAIFLLVGLLHVGLLRMGMFSGESMLACAPLCVSSNGATGHVPGRCSSCHNPSHYLAISNLTFHQSI